MAYSQIEQNYLNLLADSMLPPPDPAAEPSLEGMQLAAGPTQTRTDAPQGYGSIRAIEPTRVEKALQAAGMTLEQAGRFLDGLGQVDVPLLGPISLADIMPFVGSAKPGTRSVMGEPDWQGTPKVLQAPAAGQPIVTGKGQAMRLSEDAKLAAMDVAFNAKPVATGLKSAGKALAPTAANMMESGLRKSGMIMDVVPGGAGKAGSSNISSGLVFPQTEIDTRLRLKLQRNAAMQQGKALPGSPKNDRVVIPAPEGSNLPDFAIGKITVDDWKNRVESLLTPEQIDEYSRWYSEIKDTFMKYTDGDEQKADRYMNAWLVANQNTSVDSAMANALRQAEQFARGIPESEMQGGGLPTATEAARRALQNEPITSGVGAKIADFVDSAANKETRSFYGNDSQAGQPFVVDIHTARDTGLVDPILLNHLERLGYKVDKDAVKVDFQAGPTDTQYENRADFGRMLTQKLNDIGWQGRNDWKPYEIQAIGWMAMTRLTADAADNTVTALERNFRRISMEVAPGEGSPWAQKFGDRFAALPVERQYQVTQTVTDRAVDMARSITGVDLRGLVHGTGGWENFQNPAAVAQTLATREGAEYTANVLGYLLQQTEVWVNSVKGMTKNPKAIAVDILEDGSQNMANNDGLRQVWDAVTAADPTGMIKGYQPIRTVDGKVGIRIIVDQGGAKRMTDIQSAIEGPISQALNSLPFNTKARGYEADLVKARNDWKESPNGELYLGRLADLGRGRAPTNLNSLRQELENLFEQELAGGAAASASRGKAGGASTGAKPSKVTGASRAPAKGAQ
jgi:hypothetical protein